LDAASDLVLMDELGESITLGYVVGGINSGQTNPFSFNQTGNTNASSSVYRVTLTRTSSTGEVAIQRPTSPSFKVYPNPTDGEVQLAFELKTSMKVDLLVTDNLGRLVMNQSLGQMASGTNLVNVEGLDAHAGETMLVTLVFDHQNYASQSVLVID
jgi:hypothetical protein